MDFEELLRIMKKLFIGHSYMELRGSKNA